MLWINSERFLASAGGSEFFLLIEKALTYFSKNDGLMYFQFLTPTFFTSFAYSNGSTWMPFAVSLLTISLIAS